MQNADPNPVIIPQPNADVTVLQSVNILTAKTEFAKCFTVVDPDAACVKIHVWPQWSEPISSPHQISHLA